MEDKGEFKESDAQSKVRFEVAPVVNPELRGKIRAQFSVFKRLLQSYFGIGRKDSAIFEDLAEPTSVQDSEGRKRKLVKRITESLNKKGILASQEENFAFYEKTMGLTVGYSAPEVYLNYPGGGTFLDEKTQEVKVYLNPYLHLFKSDYQLQTVIEEGIHWSQLKHSGRRELTWQDEVEAKDKILKIKDFLGFDQQRKEYLMKERDKAMENVLAQNPQASS